MTAALQLAGAAPRPAPAWHSLDWKQVWRIVRRLQARIVKAVQQSRWGKVKALAWLLTHSQSGRAAAVLRATTNAGASTPGVDRERWSTPAKKTAALAKLRRRGYQAQPLRRIYIPKSSDPSKLRPLGIPTLRDRAMQALHLLALDPIEETTADANSYGFRSRRCCADALDQCHKILGKRNSARWVLEGDIQSCFDRISHSWLLAHVPMDKQVLGQWLAAGFMEGDAFFATTEGTPQGGIASPALANAALDGLEGLLHERFGATRRQREKNLVHFVRYADDFLISGSSEQVLREEVQPLVSAFLAERGLELSPEKTRITPVEDGFDFLGQNLRRFGAKLLLQPSRKSVQTLLAKIDAALTREGGRLSAGALIQRLNPMLRGWSLYHRHASSAETFSRVDSLLLSKLWRWARRRHKHKSAAWVKSKYFTTASDPRWSFRGVLPARKGGQRTVFLAWLRTTKVRRHVKIRGAANPYDPAWELYFEERLSSLMRSDLTGLGRARYLWLRQGGKCRFCGERLSLEGGWHVHHILWRSRGGDDRPLNLELLHPNCHRALHSQASRAALVVNESASRKGRS